jgi:integral membrane protein
MFVAMPVKYIAGNGILVKYFGWAHGVLFILYCIWLLRVWIEYRWGLVKVVLAFIASLVPFGTFVLEHKLKKEELA